MRPRLRGVVARDRLFEKLEAGGAPVAWISAAPGAGKTTLAASFCQSLDADVIWYQVDAGDADPATFFHFMRQAAINGGVLGAATLPLVSPESAAEFGIFTQQYFTELFAILPHRTILVLDNFQEANDPVFQGIMRVALERVPAHVTVIVLSLSTPPPSLARLVANGVIDLVAPDELRFTREESDAVALAKLQLDQTTLAELHERSAGWAAGLVLMIEHMRAEGAHVLPSLDASHEAVFDYFAGEVLSAFAPLEQRALMMTASLPRVTARIAEAISGLPDAGRLLEHLHRRHLFVDRRVANEPSYQYHRLFRAFLLDRSQKCFSADERLGAAEHAASLLEVAGDTEDAIPMYLAARNWDAATRLILREARSLYEQGRARTLIEWTSALPTEIVESTPWLAYWLGACQVWSSPLTARPVLERAFGRFTAIDDIEGRVRTAGVLSRACILDADWNVLDIWISELETVLCGDTTSLAPDVVLTGYSRLIYAVFARSPNHARLSTWADRTSTLLERVADPSDSVLAAFSLLTYLTWTGQTASGEQLVRHIEPMTGDARLSTVSLVYWLWASSNHTLRIGDPLDALALIDRALELAAGRGLSIAGVIRRHRIAHLLTSGRLGEAEAELDQLSTAKRVEPYFELRAWLALQKGDVAHAFDEAQVALRQAEQRGRGFYRMLDFLLLAIVCAVRGSTEEAHRHLQRYRDATSDLSGELARFQASLVEAFLALRQGARTTCHASLRRALEIGDRQRYRSWWGWTPAMVTPLLAEALAHEIGVPYCHALIKTHRLSPEKPDVDSWPWPVRIRTLGRFEVLIDGRPLRFEGKAQRRPLELLKILIALGDGAVAIERLVDLLWEPGERGGRKALDITVHRLRKLLGLEAAVEVVDRQVRLDSRFVWVDAWSLERTLNTFDAADRPLPLDDLAAAAPRILDLFGGAFLAGDVESPWLLVRRNRVTGRFRRFAERLGSHLEQGRQWDRAGALYQRVTELDPLAEAFYRRQMICLRAQGRRAEAIEAFRRCRHVLSVTLSLGPGPETQALFQELSKG